MIKMLKNPCFIYTILWCFYFCQGILYARGGFISRSIAFIILILSVVYTYRFCQTTRLVGYPRALLGILILVSLYGFIAYFTDGSIIVGIANKTPLFQWFKNMYLSILQIFTYLYFVKRGRLTIQNLEQFLPFVVVSVICYYYSSYQITLYNAQLSLGGDVSGVTNNAGYVVLTLIPVLIIFDSKKIIQYIGLFFIIVFVCMAMKRGAILISGIMSVLFIMRSIKRVSIAKKIGVCLLILMFLFFVYLFVSEYMTENDYFITRLSATKENNMSGRDEIYFELWNHFLNIDSLFILLFGGGVWYTTKVTWSAAHNDWLEILLDMGIIGFFYYVYYWFSFYLSIRRKFLPEASRFCMFLIFIDLFFRTLYSMSLESMTFIHGMMLSLSYYGLLNNSSSSKRTKLIS